MSKIVCEICGTEYDTARNKVCPVCGWSQSAAISEDFSPDADDAVKKNRSVFDYDAVNDSTPEDDYVDEMSAYAEDEPEEEAPRSNTGLIIVLTILIVLLLLACGFIFFRYFLPHMGGKQPVETAPTESTQVTVTTSETTVPTVPCTGLAITSGKAELTKAGQMFLIHTVLTPEDTTDALTFTSQDESVVTVTADGRMTAVGEGETTILVQCGEQSYSYPVTVAYEPETQATEETTLPEEETDETTGETESEATEEPAGETTAPEETTQPEETEATTEATIRTDVTLKLKRTDITIGRRGVYITLQLDCDLKPEDIQWTSDNSGIASVDAKGNVTAVSAGTTIVRAKYGDQEVEVWIRCHF